MDLKKIAVKELKKAAVKEATKKIMPMDEPKPKIGTKAKLAGILGTIAAIAAMAAEYLGG
jgi:hypothetical protein